MGSRTQARSQAARSRPIRSWVRRMSSRKRPIAARRSSGLSGCFARLRLRSSLSRSTTAARQQPAAHHPQPRVGEEPVQELVRGSPPGLAIFERSGTKSGSTPRNRRARASSRCGVRLEILEQDHLELLGREQRDIARQHVGVGLAQVVVGPDRLDEGHVPVHPLVAQVHLVDRVGPLDRVAQRGDQPRLGDEVADALRRHRIDEVVRRRLADRGLGRSPRRRGRCIPRACGSGNRIRSPWPS